jgi:two-component system phosphate regulon sensor histidine kinase PhoR
MSNDAIKNRGIFQRIFILYGAVMLLAILFVEVYITTALRDAHIATLRDNLAVQASLIADRLPFHSDLPLDSACKQLKDKTGARVTVIAPDGRVLGDSDSPSPDMDNHAHRQEIQQALLTTGMAIRYSDTIKYILYVAGRSGGENRRHGRLSVRSGIDRSINVIRIKSTTIGISIFWRQTLLSGEASPAADRPDP